MTIYGHVSKRIVVDDARAGNVASPLSLSHALCGVAAAAAATAKT